MPASKRPPPPKKTKAPGRNIAESERHTCRVVLRLSPRVRDILRDQADEQGIAVSGVSGLVSELVERTWGRLYEEPET